MKFLFVNIYPHHTVARYLLSSYVLKSYLSKCCTDGTLEIEILNFSEASKAEKIAEKALAARPDVIGYSSYIWNIELVLRLVELLKEQTQAIHVLGGPEIYPSRIHQFQEGQRGDYFVVGEGENTLLKLVEELLARPGTPVQNLPKGVAAWRDGQLVYTENSDFIRDLDRIPSIYLNRVIEDRLYHKQQAFLETQRGCRFKCKYCVYHKGVPTISHFSVGRVSQELDYLIGECQISALRIFDADFATDIERAKQIVRHLGDMKKKGITLPWIYWEITYVKADDEFLELTAGLKEKTTLLNTSALEPKDKPQHYNELLKGYTAINSIGVQSLYKPALTAVGRFGVQPQKFAAFMERIRKYNLVLKIDLILGLPQETFQTYFDGLEYMLPFLRKTDHVLNIHRLQILPGSDLELLAEKYKIQYSEEAPHMVFSTGTMSAVEFNRASKLSGLLFRLLNSPLREMFYQSLEDSKMGLQSYLENMIQTMEKAPQLANTKLIRQEAVDDDYWNDDIFFEIPSKWLGEYMGARHAISA